MKNYFLLFFIFFGWTQFSFAESVEFKSRDLRFSESPGYNGKAFGWENLITVKGELYLPTRKNDTTKSPAVILMHGSGGVRYERENYYAKLLASKGFVALIVETYSSRKNASVQNVSALAQVGDAYAAYDFLAKRSDVDSEKIFTWGFSMGGYSGYYLTDKATNRLAAEKETNFAGHISFYPGWQITFESPEPTSAPLLAVLGEVDELVDVEYAKSDIENRKSKGGLIDLHVIAGAAHAWEFREPRGFSANVINRKNCKMIISKQGGLTWKDLGTTYITCQTNGYTTGYDKKSQVIAEKLALDFLNRHTNKN
jgi:dienelactone hydrolase